MLEFLLLGALWGSSFLFTRFSIAGFGPVATAGLRVLIAAALLMPLMLWRGHGPKLVQHFPAILLVGLMNSALPFLCFAYALQSISTGLSAILNATVPLFGALIAWIWLGDRPGASRAIGLVVGFIGVAMLAWDKASFTPDASGLSSGWGVLACLLATTCYGLAASFTKRHLAGLPSLVTAAGSQLSASIFLTVPMWLLWPAQTPGSSAWLAALALGVLCTGVAYVLYFRLLESVGPSRALAVTFLVPVFAVLYGVILLSEHVSAWMLICGAVIFSGTALSSGLVRLLRK
jgi:drug/metabolite transporter (DMT)-like permease